MQNDVMETDCGGSVTCSVGYRTLQLTNLSKTDWTSYSRIAVDFKEGVNGETSFNAYLKVWDNTGSFNLSALQLAPGSGSWATLSVSVQDLVNQGLAVGNMTKVEIMLGENSPPTVCTTVYIDNLRLEQDTAPGPPSTLSALATGNTGEISISWAAGSAGSYSIAQYWLYRCTSAIATLGGLAPIKLGVVTSHLDTGRTDGTAYFYKVVAVDTVGNMSVYADGITEIDYAVPYCAPPVPAAVSIPAVDRMRVGWSGGGGATSFQIYRKAGSASVCGDLALYYTVPSTSSYYDDFTVSITGAGTYCYAVVAVKGACSSACSNVTCGTWPGTAPVPCAPPAPIMTFNVAVSGTRTDLTWDAPAPGDSALDYYEVYRSNSTGVQPVIGNLLAKIDHTGSPSYAYQNNGLQPATQYCYLIKTTAENGCTNFSSEICVTSGCNLLPPSGLSGKAYCGIVRLNWDSISATEFLVYRDTVTSSCPALSNPAYLLAVVPGVSAYYDDNTVVSGNTYNYVVTSRSPKCESTCSSIVAVDYAPAVAECPAPVMCAPPGLFGVVNGNAGTTRVTLSWDKPPDGGSAISRYVIWASTFSTGGEAFKSQYAGCPACATVYDAGGPALTATITGLQKDKQYCFVVEALDSNSPSCTRWSGEVCFATACINPGPIATISSRAIAPNSVAVAWAAPAVTEATLYVYSVYRSTCATCPITSTAGVVSDTGALGYSLTVTGLALPLDYCFTVKAEDINGCPSVSPQSCHSCNAIPLTAPSMTVTEFQPNQPAFRLDWTQMAWPEVAPVTYGIFRATCPGCTDNLIGSTPYIAGRSQFSYTVTGIYLTSPYCYKIRVVDGIGCTSWSPETCTCAVAPMTLGGFQQSGQNDRVILNWEDVGGVGYDGYDRYWIYRTTVAEVASLLNSQGVGPLVATVYEDGTGPLTRFSFTDTGVIASKMYWYQILAITTSGCSEFFQSTVTSTSGLCSFSFGPALTALPSSMVLSWAATGSTAVQKYEIFRSQGSTGGLSGKSLIALISDGKVSTYADAGLEAGKTYCYVVRLTTTDNCIFTSGELCADTVKFTAYPNPASLSKGPIRFDGLEAGASVEVYTINGDRVVNYISPNGGLWAWDGRNSSGSPVASGIYIYVVKQKSGTIRGKVVIAR